MLRYIVGVIVNKEQLFQPVSVRRCVYTMVEKLYDTTKDDTSLCKLTEEQIQRILSEDGRYCSFCAGAIYEKQSTFTGQEEKIPVEVADSPFFETDVEVIAIPLADDNLIVGYEYTLESNGGLHKLQPNSIDDKRARYIIETLKIMNETYGVYVIEQGS